MYAANVLMGPLTWQALAGWHCRRAITTETRYPYKGVNQACSAPSVGSDDIKITGYTTVSASESAFMNVSLAHEVTMLCTVRALRARGASTFHLWPNLACAGYQARPVLTTRCNPGAIALLVVPALSLTLIFPLSLQAVALQQPIDFAFQVIAGFSSMGGGVYYVAPGKCVDSTYKDPSSVNHAMVRTEQA